MSSPFNKGEGAFFKNPNPIFSDACDDAAAAVGSRNLKYKGCLWEGIKGMSSQWLDV